MSESGRCQGYDVVTNAGEHLDAYWISDTKLTKEQLYQVGILSSWLFESSDVDVLRMRMKIYNSGFIVSLTLSLVYTKSSFVHEYIRFIQHLKSRDITIKIDSKSTKTELQMVYDDGLEVLCGNQTCKFDDVSRLTSKKLKSELLASNITINDHEFDIFSRKLEVYATRINNSLIISEIVEEKRDKKNDTAISDTLTYSCFLLSIVSLLVLIVLQRKFCLVTNIPSSNIENISISLLLSSSLFVLGTLASVRKTILCYTIGVTQHYLWLSVFAFMSISVLWINTKLTRIKSRQVVQEDRYCMTKKTLTLLGLVVPLVFVGPCVYIDINGPPYWSAGYGQNYCFPNQYPSNLAFFTGPIVLTVAVNFLSLTYIVFKICVIRIEASHIRKLNPYKDATIYLRVTILSGILWVSGILATLFNVDWLNYIFTVLCGLQGFFLVVANLTSSRVRCVNRIRQRTSTRSSRT